MQISPVTDKQSCHDNGDCVRCVIFGIYAATIGIVILDDILKYASEEVVAFRKCIFKREVDEFVNQGSCERRTLVIIGYEICELLKQRYFFL